MTVHERNKKNLADGIQNLKKIQLKQRVKLEAKEQV